MKKLIFMALKFAVFTSVLVSCAIEQGRKDDAETPVVVNVDASVQRDFDRALALLKQDNIDEAIAVLESVIGREPRLPAPFTNLGIAYNKKGDKKKAEEYLKKALEKDEYHPEASNELGLLYRKSGRFDEARQAYQKTLDKNPRYIPAIKNLGILCDLYLQDFACALQQYELYQEQVPSDDKVKIWIADLQRRAGK